MDSSVDSPGCSSCLLRNSLLLRLEGLCHNTFLGIHSLMMSLSSEDIRIIMMQNDLHPNHHEGSFRENDVFIRQQVSNGQCRSISRSEWLEEYCRQVSEKWK